MGIKEGSAEEEWSLLRKSKNTQHRGREAEKTLAGNNELGPEKDTTKMVIYDKGK